MKIGTHNGEFHCDDVMAVAALLLLHPDAEIVRSRDAAVLATCDVLVDVGGKFNPATGRFDHHQREGAPSPRANGVKYSSFGLVWREYGAEIAGSVEAARIVDRDLVQGVDALDNGQGSKTLDPALQGAEHATLSGVVATFNPTWQEVQHGALYDSAFSAAVKVAGTFLLRAVEAARAEVAMIDTLSPIGEGIVLCPLKGVDAFSAVRSIADTGSDARFLVFQAGNGEWSAQAVPPTRARWNEQRTPFPEAWAWKRGADLAAASGVSDAIFSHGGGFFACAATREGAVALCKGALALS